MQVQLWAKLCDKERCYWEHLGEHGENVIGNAWTHVENILGNTLATWWEHQYPKKLTHTTFSLSPIPAPCPLQKPCPQGEKNGSSYVHVEP